MEFILIYMKGRDRESDHQHYGKQQKVSRRCCSAIIKANLLHITLAAHVEHVHSAVIFQWAGGTIPISISIKSKMNLLDILRWQMVVIADDECFYVPRAIQSLFLALSNWPSKSSGPDFHFIVRPSVVPEQINYPVEMESAHKSCCFGFFFFPLSSQKYSQKYWKSTWSWHRGGRDLSVLADEW